LSNNVRNYIPREEATRGAKTNCHRRIKMTSGHMTNRIRHSQYGETEGERNAKQSNANARKCGRQHRAATSTEHQPECAQELSG
jgi:hypothetical protein